MDRTNWGFWEGRKWQELCSVGIKLRGWAFGRKGGGMGQDEERGFGRWCDIFKDLAGLVDKSWAKY